MMDSTNLSSVSRGYSDVEDEDGQFMPDNLDAAREDELRYQRYLQASRLRSGEAQGLFAQGGLPEVTKSSDYVDPAHPRPAGAANAFNGGVSFRDLPEAGTLDSDGDEDEEDLLEATTPSLPGPNGHTSTGLSKGRSGILTYPSIHEEPEELQTVITLAPHEVATANSTNTNPAAATVVTMAVTGHGAGGAEPATDGPAAEAGTSLLSHLPVDQQMVLSFTRISSWVEIGNLGAEKKPLKERLAPANVARAMLKPLQDGAKGAAKVGNSAGAAAQKLHTALSRGRRGSSAGGGRDVEMGGDSATSIKLRPAMKAAPSPAGHRQILHAITGHVAPGQVLALMGPSGSGKTSLLSIIGGRAPSKVKLDGAVTVNGQKMNKLTRRRIGFVLQDDVLYETLTVHETLMYAGLLRLPRSMSKTDKMARVDAVIEVLGLTKSRNTIIGGFFRRGVSGGERKRVSVGHELLINPAVLLLDEPTSGLDSTTALHLVNLLRDLAQGGRAILTTIHQPSSRLYRQLDQVMLLAEGHVMYYGDALRAVDWFDHLGFGLPYGTNLADHLLDCAMGEVQHDPQAPGAAGRTHQDMSGTAAVRVLYTTFEQWYASHPGGFTVPRSSGTTTTRASLDKPGTGYAAPASTTHTGVKATPFALGTAPRMNSSSEVEELLKGVQLSQCRRRSSQVIAMPHLHFPASTTTSLSGAAAAPAAGGAAATTTQHTGAAGAHGNGLPLPKLPPSAPGRAQQESRLTANGAGGVDGVGFVSKGKARDAESSSSSSESGQLEAANAAARQRHTLNRAPFLEQALVLWKRAIKVRRFETLTGMQLGQLICVAVITGLLWWQRGGNADVSGAADITGLLFFELVFSAFRALFSALFTFPNEFRMLSKERPSGMYKLSAYYLARTAADLPIEVLYPSLFVIVTYWFGGLRATPGAFFANWASVLITVVVAQSWGLLIGGLFMDPKMAQAVTTVIMLTFMLVGGYYVRDVQVWISWVKYLSFIYWGNNLLLKIEFNHKDMVDCTKLLPDGSCTPVTDLQNALRMPVDPNSAAWPEVVVLLGMLIVLRWASYVVLKWKTNNNAKTL